MNRFSLSTVFLLLVSGTSLPLSAQETATQPMAPAAAEPAPADIDPAVVTSPAETPTAATQAKPAEGKPDGPRQFKTIDRLELDSTAITGNRELPKVLYIVPWKKSDLGDLLGRPANSLLDEVLAPVDREVFRRQTDYFTKLNTDAAAPGTAPPAPAP